MTATAELSLKLERVRRFLHERSLTGCVLQKTTNLAWILGGAETWVARTVERGSLTVVIGNDGCHALMNAVEAPRLEDEELAGLGLTPHVFPWYADRTNELIAELAGSAAISDTGAAGTRMDEAAILDLQVPLTEGEIARYRVLGAQAGEALGEAMRSVQPGMTEHEIAGLIAQAVLRQGMVAAVVLVAVDERVLKYRHPVPTDRKLERYAMGVLVARRGGLHASLTRCVHFGPLPPEIEERQAAVTAIDARILEATRPGVTDGDIMALAQRGYAEAGYPDEWQLHHQGGATGYQPRTWRAVPGGAQVIQAGQAFAWNPSLQGTKSEDTILCHSEGVEILTTTSGWPTLSISVAGRSVERPAIWVQ